MVVLFNEEKISDIVPECTKLSIPIIYFGKVVKGMEFVDMIKKGDPNSGSVPIPDKIISIKSK